MLKSRLYELELKKREEKANAAAAAKTEIGWGHQIRSYVLQPYQLVKDLRTGTQSSDPQQVLNGDIDTFIESALAQKVSGSGPAKVEDIDWWAHSGGASSRRHWARRPCLAANGPTSVRSGRGASRARHGQLMD